MYDRRNIFQKLLAYHYGAKIYRIGARGFPCGIVVKVSDWRLGGRQFKYRPPDFFGQAALF